MAKFAFCFFHYSSGRSDSYAKKLKLDVTIPSQEMVRFINDLSKIQIDVNDKFLMLSDNVYFERKPHYRTNLFIRQCYRDLANIILEIVNDGSKHPYFMIHGNPGIGKSYFVYYLLHLLLQHDNTIVWEKSQNISQAVLITRSKNTFTIQKGPLEVFEGYLEKKTTWYIVDGTSPKNVVARTILICSTRKEYFHEYLKFHEVDIRVMPVWAEEEIEECRNKLYSNLSTDLVLTLYSKRGGIPRFILQNANNEVFQKRLEYSLEKPRNLSHIIRCPGHFSDDVTHQYLQVTAEEHYREGPLRFLSPYISRKLAGVYEREEKASLRDFLSISKGTVEMSCLRGNLFEGYSHNHIMRGGHFRVRSLNASSLTADEIVSISGTEFESFGKLDEIVNDG